MSGEAMDFLAIVEAKDGSIWFGSGGGVFRYDGKTVKDFKEAAGQQMRPSPLFRSKGYVK
ncbi:hypothetical protein [Paraflavitalea pollutisoli]|uniref:hypothetical protein n=1 Tax=Paraflavitalea pollutisoli TaxID=3034143 RepID=UPI0023EC8BB9|nr:hypothetical protein [Paraflavitalea sp. H1-2-19X]